MDETVAIYDPPRRVQYRDDAGGFIQFDLEAIGPERTRLTSLQHFAAGTGREPSEWPGGDQPAGPDTPWKTGFIAGFHGMLDQLGDYLDGTWTREHAQRGIDTVYANGDLVQLWEYHPETRSPSNRDGAHERLIDVYREHVTATYPR